MERDVATVAAIIAKCFQSALVPLGKLLLGEVYFREWLDQRSIMHKYRGTRSPTPKGLARGNYRHDWIGGLEKLILLISWTFRRRS